MIKGIIADNILILPDPIEAEENTGFITPEELKEKPLRGIVIAANRTFQARETGEEIEIEVSVGDRVIFQRYRGTSVNFDNVDYFFLRQDEILAII